MLALCVGDRGTLEGAGSATCEDVCVCVCVRWGVQGDKNRSTLAGCPCRVRRPSARVLVD